MPRIDAPTVAEHRARRHTALLVAAREVLLAEGPQGVTPAAVGERAGLARSSVYKYFSASADILFQIVEDIFADWTGRLRAATEGAAEPAAQVAIYVRMYVEFARSDDRKAGYSAAAALPPDRLPQVMELHDGFNAPLREALAEGGDPDPAGTAELVLGTLQGATRLLDLGRSPEAVVAAVLAFLPVT